MAWQKVRAADLVEQGLFAPRLEIQCPAIIPKLQEPLLGFGLGELRKEQTRARRITPRSKTNHCTPTLRIDIGAPHALHAPHARHPHKGSPRPLCAEAAGLPRPADPETLG